jgi:hypothetical protein
MWAMQMHAWVKQGGGSGMKPRADWRARMVVQESYSFWKNGGLLRLGAALPGQTRPGLSAMMGIYQRQCKKWRSASTQAAQ